MHRHDDSHSHAQAHTHASEMYVQGHIANAHQPARVQRRPLVLALLITSTFLVMEVIGGILTNSLALLADAGHMATDAGALALSLFAVWLAARPATPERSFGFLRAEVLAALFNAASLIAISLYIFWEAVQRIGEPPEIDSGPMLGIAVIGLLANAASAWVLSRGGGHTHNLNTRGAYLHVVGDMLGSVGAIVAALVMLATGWYLVDPLLSAGIGMLILWSSWRLLRESLDVLLEATPPDIDLLQLRAALTSVPGISGVHDLHVWTVTSGLIALSGHVEVTDDVDWETALIKLTGIARAQFGIAHVTLQPERFSADTTGSNACMLDSPEGIAACRALLDAPPLRANDDHGHQH